MQQALVPVSMLPVVVFDSTKGSALLPQFDGLGSFAEANRWVAQARAEIEGIERPGQPANRETFENFLAKLRAYVCSWCRRENSKLG